jgi:7-cyano-7-deazaguanine reductase
VANDENSGGNEGMLLGVDTPVPRSYDPDILFAIPRSAGRAALGLDDGLRFFGMDVWHAYELSWRERGQRPVSRVGRLEVPAASGHIVESKSLKLYLNSLNNHVFDIDEAAAATIATDVGAVVGAEVTVELFAPDDTALAGRTPPGRCLDDAPLDGLPGSPTECALRVSGEVQEVTWYSHLLRSLCPVTGQPDWATVWLDYRGPGIDPGSLLAYLLSYREHQEFHEQCVERIFTDICRQASPERLTVQALYTRRGGLDICPLRSTEPGAASLPRQNRQ